MENQSMQNPTLEIASAEYLAFITERLSETEEGVMLSREMFEAIENHYGDQFTEADSRPMNLPNGTTRPKWMNNVDWAKATGTKQGKLATITHKKQRWIVLIEAADERWIDLATKRKKKSHFKKKCPCCAKYRPLSEVICDVCGNPFPTSRGKRRISS